MPSGTGFDLSYTGEQVNEAIGRILNSEQPITYLEGTTGEGKINLRNLETGVYVISGYASPFAGSSHTLVFSRALVSVSRKDAGSHVMVLSALNCIINFLEILVDETTEKGFTYTRTNIELLELLNTVNSLSSGADRRLSEVTLTANGWVGDASPYSQTVTIDNITENSQVDLTPSVEQLAIFYDKSLAFVTENEDGVVTVYAIGQKPENDYTIQVTITEVRA